MHRGVILRPRGANTSDVDETINVKAFPSTRYQGSKRKIAPWLYKIFSEIDFDSALDLFGGSATVSYLLKRMGKRVTYNDLLRCNYLMALAIIENDSVTLERSFKVKKPRVLEAREYRYVRDNFRGYYFTDYENAWIDRAVFTLDSLNGKLTDRPYRRALGYYALFQACLIKRPFNLFHRKNLYLRTANVERTFGNKTAWDTPISQMFDRFAHEANECVFRGKHRCRAYNYAAEKFPRTAYDLVYFDCPYISNKKDIETSDYLTSYHFLEGLAQYADWPSLVDNDSYLLALKQKKPNQLIDPKTNKTALRRLFERFEKSTLVISYKKFGTPSVSWFRNELQRLGKRVNVYSRHYKYALNHQNGDAAYNREIVIVAR